MADPHVNEDEVRAALRTVPAPGGGNVVEQNVVSELSISDRVVSFGLKIGRAEAVAKEPLRAACAAAVEKVAGVRRVNVALVAEAVKRGHQDRPPAPTPEAIPGVAAILAVASGKGGVGKSTTAVNLALALGAQGKSVGVLDADIYGPSLPMMLGTVGAKPKVENRTIEPVEILGLRTMSMGYLVPKDNATIWRGPMVTSAIQQFLRTVNWGNLDVLVVDFPPGTGDAHLTLAQTVPITGAVIVSTPQDIALIDARKGAQMFEKVGVPVLGFVENMSYFVCPNCSERSEIFGHGGARTEADQSQVAFLGEIPLDARIRQAADSGIPIVTEAPKSPQALKYITLAAVVAKRIQPLANSA